MTETVNFTYKSIGNFVRLLATIKYEQIHNPREIAVWHERFDNDESDELFETFLEKLFPNGSTIDIPQIEQLVSYIENFMDRDKETRKIRNKYIKFDNPYWVYFKINDVVTPCRFGDHAKVIQDILLDYFKDFDLDDFYLKRFIMSNFEIKSDNSDIEKIANDSKWITKRIRLNGIRSEQYD